MSTTDNLPNGDQSSVNDGETQTPEIKNPAGLLKKNAELLAKLKAEQEKARAHEERLAQIEQDQLAAAGKKDELIDSLKKQVKEHQDKLKSVTQTFALKSVNSQVMDAARAMGCEKPEVVMRLADLSSVSVSDDFSVDAEALKTALDQVKSQVPELFKRTPGAIKDGSPATSVTGQKPISGMSISELQQLYMEKALKG